MKMNSFKSLVQFILLFSFIPLWAQGNFSNVPVEFKRLFKIKETISLTFFDYD